MEWYLPVIWAALIGTAVAMYVILDGFDLGIGILFPFARSESAARPDDEFDRAVLGRQRDLAGARRRRIVGRVPDRLCRHHAGDVSAGDRDAARAGVPRRGVRIPPRLAKQGWWNFAFTAGSALAAFSQGVILGGLIQGIKVENGAFAGGHFDWATPFALLCGARARRGYALLGATWLIMKTEGEVAERARGAGEGAAARGAWLHGARFRCTRPCLRAHRRALVLAAELLLSVAGAVRRPRCSPSTLWRWIETRRDALPFVATIGLFLLGYLGLVISSYPYLVPPSLTVWDTAAAPASQIFMLIGTVFLLPIILGYIDLHLLAVPRQGARRRKYHSSSWVVDPRRQRVLMLQAGLTASGAPYRGAFARIMPQPTRSSGSAPWTGRSKARGTSARDREMPP